MGSVSDASIGCIAIVVRLNLKMLLLNRIGNIHIGIREKEYFLKLKGMLMFVFWDKILNMKSGGRKMHKKPVIVRNLRKVEPTKRFTVSTKLITNGNRPLFRTITLHRNGIISTETIYGTIYKELKSCWSNRIPKSILY